jgi:hypothetical protein
VCAKTDTKIPTADVYLSIHLLIDLDISNRYLHIESESEFRISRIANNSLISLDVTISTKYE